MFTITKEFKFEAAHRLVKGYSGNCSHNHGHSWVVRVTLEGPVLDGFDMLRDYGDLKPVRKFIDDNLDHATMLCKDDAPLFKFLLDNNQRFYIFDSNPTSEALARMLFAKVKELGFTNVKSVHVDETCTSTAMYHE